jgi:hypothetical protein
MAKMDEKCMGSALAIRKPSRRASLKTRRLPDLNVAANGFMRQIHFFALKDDLLPVLETVERDGPLKYISTDNSTTADYRSVSHGIQIPNLGIARSESAINCETFLVAESAVAIRVRPIELNAGGVSYAIDQLVNPDTITLTPGGLWGSDIVLKGNVGTVSDSELAQQLMKRFSSAVKRHFKKVKAFWIGPQALGHLDTGKRLTIAAQSPQDFDLTRD